eukprot:EC716606.1.p2 GENE.EC716606.1~~EC716606.1.p2  ORF type:complete len:134 (+),score=31.00 EC716606.1:155-556(+)
MVMSSDVGLRAAKIKAHELRTQSKADLLKQLEDLKKELSQLRVAQVTGGNAARLSKIRVVRKSIARVLTVINQTTKSQLRGHFAGKKWVPLDLRKKLTRSKRRALTRFQLAQKTSGQVKDRIHFPQLKYAVQA